MQPNVIHHYFMKQQLYQQILYTGESLTVNRALGKSGLQF